jgi:hypothetical protein
MAGARCASAAPGSIASIREPPFPPSAPPGKPFADQGFFMLGFHHGFSGNVEFEPSSTALASAALASTYGFNLRGDVPVERFLVLGPLFQFGSWRPDVSPAPSRSYYIDADLYIRARLPIATNSTNFQFWLGVPIGLTFNILGPDAANVSGAGLGWNVGVMGGGAVHFTPKFGLFAELGWIQHKVTHDAEPNLYLRLAQWTLNIGFVFRE